MSFSQTRFTPRPQLQLRGQGQSQGALCRYPVHGRIKSIDGLSCPRTAPAAVRTELHCVCHRVTRSKALWPLGKASPRKRMAHAPPSQATPALSASSIPANLETHCKAWRSEPQDPALGLLALPIPFASILVKSECSSGGHTSPSFLHPPSPLWEGGPLPSYWPDPLLPPSKGRAPLGMSTALLAGSTGRVLFTAFPELPVRHWASHW